MTCNILAKHKHFFWLTETIRSCWNLSRNLQIEIEHLHIESHRCWKQRQCFFKESWFFFGWMSRQVRDIRHRHWWLSSEGKKTKEEKELCFKCYFSEEYLRVFPHAMTLRGWLPPFFLTPVENSEKCDRAKFKGSNHAACIFVPLVPSKRFRQNGWRPCLNTD